MAYVKEMESRLRLESTPMCDSIKKVLDESSILTRHSFEFLRNKLLTGGQTFGPKIYSSVEDGLTASSFHSRCDSKGPTLTVVKRDTGRVFGGFAPIAWRSPEVSPKVKSDDVWIFDIGP